MSIVRNILVRVGADINPLQKKMSLAQRSINQFSSRTRANMSGFNSTFNKSVAGAAEGASAIKGSSSLAGAAIAGFAVAAGAAFAAVSAKASKVAMNYEAAFQQINRLLGESSRGFFKWSQSKAADFNLSKNEATEYGAVYSNLISNMISDQSKISKLTRQLLKSSAVVASGTSREMTDVMDRIRSGLLGNTEAIEDLGINVNVAMLESTNAFQRFANGKSWDQLSFQTQQQIRLFAILEQATAKYGNEINKNTASGMAKFNAYLKDAQLNLGQGFLPIIQAVQPTLISFAQDLASVTNTFAQFTQALFGANAAQAKNAKAAAAAATAQANVGNATYKASQKAKRSIAGFDEINQLQESIAQNAEDAAGSIGNAPSTLSTPEVGNMIPKEIIEFAQKIKRKLTPAFNDLRESWDGLKKSGIELWNNINPLMDTAGNIMISLAKGGIYKLSGALKELDGIITIFNGLVTGDFEKAVSGLEKFIDGSWTVGKGIVLPILEIIDPDIEKKFNAFERDIKKRWGGLKKEIKSYGDSNKLELSDFVSFAKDVIQNKMNDIISFFPSKWKEFKSDVKSYSDPNKLELGDFVSFGLHEVTEKLDSAFTFISGGEWTKFKNHVKTYGDPNKLELADFVSFAKEKIDSKITPIVTYFSGRWATFKDDIKKYGDPNKLEFSDYVSFAKDKIGAKINDTLKYFTGGRWQTFKSDMKKYGDPNRLELADFVSFTKDKIGLKITSAYNDFKTKWTKFKSDIKKYGDPNRIELSDFIKFGAKSLLESVKNGINDVIGMLNRFIAKINGIKITVPSVDIPGIGKVGGGTLWEPKLKDIPKLGTGAVIPPNSPFLAELGDQKSGVNIETPLDTMVQAFKTAMADTKGGSGGASTIILKIGETELAKVVVNGINNLQRQTGVTLLTV